MRETMKIGCAASHEIVVDESMCPAFDGIIIHRVYSTWSLAHHMEIAARMVLVPHLEGHEEGIGSHLSIDHTSPVPVGHRVRIDATATEVDPTRVVCLIRAYHVRPCGEHLVATGKQVQRVLPRSRLAAIIERAS